MKLAIVGRSSVRGAFCWGDAPTAELARYALIAFGPAPDQPVLIRLVGLILWKIGT
jgi:hypothetical protein